MDLALPNDARLLPICDHKIPLLWPHLYPKPLGHIPRHEGECRPCIQGHLCLPRLAPIHHRAPDHRLNINVRGPPPLEWAVVADVLLRFRHRDDVARQRPIVPLSHPLLRLEREDPTSQLQALLAGRVPPRLLVYVLLHVVACHDPRNGLLHSPYGLLHGRYLALERASLPRFQALH